jgi:hypothetical protein
VCSCACLCCETRGDAKPCVAKKSRGRCMLEYLRHSCYLRCGAATVFVAVSFCTCTRTGATYSNATMRYEGGYTKNEVEDFTGCIPLLLNIFLGTRLIGEFRNSFPSTSTQGPVRNTREQRIRWLSFLILECSCLKCVKDHHPKL